jgi:hypothetical protein
MNKDIYEVGTMLYNPKTKLVGWIIEKNVDLSGTKLLDSYWNVEWSNGHMNCLPFCNLNRVISEYKKLDNA